MSTLEPIAQRKEVMIMTVEPGESSLSTRKLLIESVGFNAVSAISGKQALWFIDRYPIHAAILDTDIEDVPFGQLIETMLRRKPELPIYVVARNGYVEPEVRKHVRVVFEKMADPKIIVEELTEFFAGQARTEGDASR